MAVFGMLSLMGCRVSPQPHTLPSEPLSGLSSEKIQIGNQVFTVEIAKTDDELHRGLMFRDTLQPDSGMLFVFEKEDYENFWMKNTRIPLDIVWISSDKTVVDVQTMQPCLTDPCPLYTPQTKSQYVLEVNQGAFQGKLGDPLLILKK